MSASIERDDPRLTEVLRRWGELQEQGSNLSAEEFLSTCPELAGETDRWIGVLREISPQPDIAEAATNVHDSGDRTPESSRDSASARAEYRELRFHAAGALGEVYLARNTECGNPGKGRVRMALVAETDECVEAAKRIVAFVKGAKK